MRAVLYGILVIGVVLAEDLTIKDKATGSEVVDAVLDILEQSCIFPDDKLMLRRIAKVETNDGKNQDTFTKDGTFVVGGIWGVSVEKLYNISVNIKTEYITKIKDTFNIDWTKITSEDLIKPLYSALAARLWLETTGADIPWNSTAQANFWANTYHSSEDPKKYVDAADSLEEACEVDKADLVFVLDGSGSIGSGNFKSVLDFASTVVDGFEISDDKVRTGVIKFSGDAKTEFYLGQISDKQDVKDRIDAIDYEKGGTNTAAAMDDLRSMFNKYGRGAGVPQLSIVLTDGQSNDQSATLKAVQKVHDQRLTVFAVGVTSGIDMTELNAIGTDPDCVHVHVLDQFTDIQPFTSKIKQQACKAPGEITPEKDCDGSVRTGRRVYFKLKIKRNKKGLTIKLKLKSGAARMYISFKARNPGPAFYKYQLRIHSGNRDGGRMYIPWPEGYSGDEMDVFAALMGDGYGQQNLFNIGMNDGDFSSDGAVTRPALLCMFVTAVVAIFGGKIYQ